MVDAKYFMAAERNGYNGQIFEALRSRFPEIPERIISQTLQAEHGNTERCLRILAAESDRFLYGGGGDMLDSPMPVHPSSQNTPIDEPISITIPNTNTSPYLPNRTTPPPLQPLMRPMTVAQPSPGMEYVSSCPVERPPPSASVSYDQTLLCHQRQRLDTLKKEMYNEQHKLIRLRNELQDKEMEMWNLKYCVAANPTSIDVKHLRDENHVLREEIEQMTHEIDQLSYGREALQPYQPPPVRRVESFPSSRPHSNTNGPPISLQRLYSMFGGTSASSAHAGEESPSSLSPPPDGGSNEWEFLPPNFHNSEETTWTCTVCTFANHEALEVCEMCDMPRNRALEARA